MREPSLALVAVSALVLPALAAAHGVSTEVERRGAEIAVRARYEGGRPLAGARFVVISPARPERSHLEGLTDRDGWAVFAPDAPGKWKVRIADSAGHGGVVQVEVAPPQQVDVAPPQPPATPPPPGVHVATTPTAAPPASAVSGSSARAVAGVVLIALLFGGLWAAGRRRRRGAGG